MKFAMQPVVSILVLSLSLVAFPAAAQMVKVKTPAPVIHLIDNLDEKDGLGWCIDTVGRGFADKLHAHSCKPRGGDVQFTYVDEQIRSATFEGKCATATVATAAGLKLGLLDCDENDERQKFIFDPLTGNKNEPKHLAGIFSYAQDMDLCLVVGEESRSAGPFMSRDLLVAPCYGPEFKFKAWNVIEE